MVIYYIRDGNRDPFAIVVGIVIISLTKEFCGSIQYYWWVKINSHHYGKQVPFAISNTEWELEKVKVEYSDTGWNSTNSGVDVSTQHTEHTI